MQLQYVLFTKHSFKDTTTTMKNLYRRSFVKQLFTGVSGALLLSSYKSNDPQNLMGSIAKRLSDDDIQAVSAWYARQNASQAEGE